MNDASHNALQGVVGKIRDLLEPLAQGVTDEGVRREILLAVGLDPAQATQALNVPPAALASIDAYRRQAAGDVDLKALISVLQDISQVVQALVDMIRSAAAADPNAPPGFIVEEAVSFYLNAIALGTVRVHRPGVYAAAKALQLIEEQALRFGGITQLLFRAGEFFEQLWGSAKDLQTDADAERVSDVVLFLTGAVLTGILAGDFIYGYDAGPGSASPQADAASDRTLTMRFSGTTKDLSGNTVKGSVVVSAVLLPQDHGGAGLLLRIQADASLDVPFGKNFTLKISSEGPDIIVYLGRGNHQFPTSTGASFGLKLEYKSTTDSPLFWGDDRGIHLRVGKIGFDAIISTSDHQVKAEIKDSAFVLATESADGFLRTVLSTVVPNGKLETTFAFEVGHSKKRGFFVGGGAGLTMAIPLHETLGPIKLDTLVVGLAVGERAGKEPGVRLEGSLSFGLDLGVLQASVDRIGLAGMVAFDDDREFTLDFKPPNGVGLLIDAGAVRGGGFLSFDPERGEYAGVLEIDISGIITVKAIGLITTKLPDGSPGFTLLIILTAEFGTPLGPFGPGFFIIGFGGLLGLNRSMRLELLAQGVRTGSVDRILFPTNIVANAARIVSDLRTFFPPQNGPFLVGPMVKLGWGKPILVRLSLGVIIQIPPGNVAILGVLRVILPDEKAAILELQAAFIGAIEFDKKRAWFFATLFDSRVLKMTLEGGMGVLVGWGDNTNFVISVGGFHPQFQPPPLPFPVPDRLAINILNTPVARIRVMAYFAVTSNTVQFGAKVELFFGFDSVSIEGHLAFDALFQFSPFYFIIEISASVSLKVLGAGLFSVRLRGSLEGPTPWKFAGVASVSFFFFEISVDFEETWGEGADTTLPATAVMPLLASEYDKETNWKAELPAGGRLMVSLRQLEAVEGGLVLHPLGQLRVSQRAVPLEITIDKVGNQRAADANLFHLRVNGTDLAKRGNSDELFAIAQYQEIPDSKKLSLPAFQPEAGGVVLAATGQQLRSSRLVKRRARYEMITIDTNFKRFVRPFFAFWINLFTHFIRGNAVALSELSHRRHREVQPFTDRVTVAETAFAVAKVRDNTPFAAQARSFGSEAHAREYLRQQVAADRTLSGKLHVIPRYEVNEAA